MPRPKQTRNIPKARHLRTTMTLPEVLLWQILRRQPMNIKFRRQHPIGPYVLDFYCPSAKLAIEIDGTVHDMGNRPAHDAQRIEWLAENGIKTLRIPATEVLKSPETVADTIIRMCLA
jgi:very-short-patch-repair endonuclease